jgi:tetratricopeptide (TPR) repeat protein
MGHEFAQQARLHYRPTMAVAAAFAAVAACLAVAYFHTGNRDAHAWLPNLATAAATIALTITFVQWIIRREERTRLAPLLEVAPRRFTEPDLRAALRELARASLHTKGFWEEAATRPEMPEPWATRLDPGRNMAETRRMPEEPTASTGDAQAVYARGVTLQAQGELSKALATLERALDLARKQGQRLGEGATLNRLGTVYLELGRLEEAREHCEQALPILREMADREGEAVTLYNLGAIWRKLGSLEEARRSYVAARTLYHAQGDTKDELETTMLLGAVAYDSGRRDEAFDELRHSLKLYHQLCNELDADSFVGVYTPLGEGGILETLGSVALELGRREKATEFYRAAFKALNVHLRLDLGGEEPVEAPLERVSDPDLLALALRAHEAPCDSCGRSLGEPIVMMTCLVCKDCYPELKRKGEALLSTSGWGELWHKLVCLATGS